MNVIHTRLPGVLIFEPKVWKDDRGHFLESFHAPRYAAHGLTQPFVQDNWSRSKRHSLRGLHFQWPRAQGKLVMVTRGVVFDVAVDVRKGSPHFGQWVGVELSEDNARQLWVPPGFAHGFVTLSDVADFLYKCTDVYVPEDDGVIAWNDPDLAITWPTTEPLLSKKDAAAPRLKDAPRLPTFA